MDIKKVLFIAPFPKGRYEGGITSIAKTLQERCKEVNYFDIELVFFNSHEIYQSNSSIGRLKFENFHQAYSLIKRLQYLLKHDQFSLIHFNSSHKLGLFKDLLILYLFFRKELSKTIVHIHFCGLNQTFLKNNILFKIQLHILKQFRNIIVLSRKFKNELVDCSISEDKIQVLYNFHSLGSINSYNKKNISSLHLLFLGSIDKRKGFLDLLNSLDGVNNIELNVGGTFTDSSIEEETYNICKTHNLNVKFHGFVTGEAKELLFKISDILVLPSYGEGFPMVIVEALAYGLTIISTPVGAIQEIIKDGKNGFLFNPGEINRLAQIINKLSQNTNLLIEISNNNRSESNKYDFNNYLSSLVNIYKS